MRAVLTAITLWLVLAMPAGAMFVPNPAMFMTAPVAPGGAHPVAPGGTVPGKPGAMPAGMPGQEGYAQMFSAAMLGGGMNRFASNGA